MYSVHVCMCMSQSLDTLDNGKPFKDALNDVSNAVRVARYYAGLADKVVGQTVPAGNFEYSLQLSLFFALSI